MRPMVSGERLVLSTLLAGLYLPGIEELYLSALGRPSGGQSTDIAKESRLTYLSELVLPGEIPGSCENYPDSLSQPVFDAADALSLDALALLADAAAADFVLADSQESSVHFGWAPTAADCVKDSLTLYGGGRRLLDLIREKSPTFADAPELLRRFGFASEAARLERPGLMDLARQFVLEGAVLTPFHPEASWIWQKCSSLPYALWCTFPRQMAGGAGTAPEFPRRLFGVVGSRDVDSAGRLGAAAAALALQQGGWTLITGGAVGVDSIALDAIGETLTPRGVVLHPYGLSTNAGQKLRRTWPWAWHLSLCAPWQEFEGRWAHQRNRIIFTLSEGAVSIGPRLRRGGTWSGALECLRNKLAPLAVLADSGDKEALSVLQNLGAFSLCLADLGSTNAPTMIGQIVEEGRRRRCGLWAAEPEQAGLFDPDLPDRLAVYGNLEKQQGRESGSGRVRERQGLYTAGHAGGRAA